MTLPRFGAGPDPPPPAYVGQVAAGSPMPTAFAALMCHAPIVVPAVAGREAARCARTTRAMREVAARLVHAAPDRLVVVSPHSPRRTDGFGAWRGPHHGDLAAFRAPQVCVELPDAPEVAAALGLVAIGAGRLLDHGAVVPLTFLWEAGWRGPTAILALPWEAGGEEDLGRRLASLRGRTAVIASGDMSHCLTADAPSGYNPAGPRFDAAFVKALRASDWAAAVHAPREAAAEDVVDSARVAMGAAGGPLNAEVLAYEAPWGVGYTEAIFADPTPPLWAVARAAIRAHLRGERYAVPSGGPSAAPVFVSLHDPRGELRGCIGTLAATRDRRYAEVASAAVSAATEDPRFPPVSADELDTLAIEVSTLDPAQPVADPAELDPKVWGVIGTAGGRRALLLPGIDGVDTVAQQLAIVRKKAGIPADAPMGLQKFTVTKEASP